jgi:hypothetical protein
MSTAKQTYKTYLWGLAMVLLTIPMVKQCFFPWEPWALNGSFSVQEKPEFSWAGWFSGDYQDAQQEYDRQHIGFRPALIRMYNQSQYSLHGHTDANGVVIGKEGYLYEHVYINAYVGKDFKGEDYIKERVRLLSIVEDSLRAHGVELIVVLAPGKATFYPEYLPEGVERSDSTNYTSYQQRFREFETPLIDANQWFRNTKETSQYPLVPKNGIHWSHYGELLLADSLADRIEHILARPMPDIAWDEVDMSSKMKYRDQDVEDGMNLVFDIPDLEMAYPVYRYENQGQDDVKVICVADSYYWGLYNLGYSTEVLGGGQFWYYGKEAFSSEFSAPKKIEEMDVYAEVLKNDAVVLMSTDYNLNRFAFGFVDLMYDAFNPDGESLRSQYDERVEAYMEQIRNTPDWLQAVADQAAREGVTVEESIRNNAEFMVSQE